MSYVLGIDLGTTYTSAAVVAAGRAEVVQLGLRSSVVPTVVFLTEDGQLLIGETANRRAVTSPTRVAREFKRRVGDTAPLLLGGTPVAPQALMASMLRWVLDRVSTERGEAPAHVAVSHPANWGPYKLGLLEQAVRLADLESVTTITEPEAAARYYATTQRLAPGDVVAVYDLGGGTFDAAVLEATPTGFAILGTPEGIEHLGGIDIDEAVFGYVARALGGALEQLDPDDPLVTSGAARLRRDCVEAKEALSTDTEVVIPVMLPGVQSEVTVTRDEIDALVRPTLAATIGALERALRSAQVAPDQLTAVLLVGGASRMPVVAELVSDAVGRRVAVDTHPKHAVSLGTALEAESALAREQGMSQPVAEVIPPRDTPVAPLGMAVTPSEPPPTGVGRSGRPSRPTISSGTPDPPPPTPPPAPPGPAGDGENGGADGDGHGGDDDDDDDGGGLGRGWRRSLYVGAPVAAIVILAAILVALRGGDDGGADSGGDFPAVSAPTPASDTPAEMTESPGASGTDLTTTDPAAGVESTAGSPLSTTTSAVTTGPAGATTEPQGYTTEPTDATTEAPATTTTASGPSAAIAGLTAGRRLPVGSFPDGVTVDARGRLWVASTGGNRLTRIEPETGRQQILSFDTGTEPLAVMASPDAIFVTLSGVDQVARVDPDTFGVEQLSVSDRPAFLAWGAGSLWSVADAGWVDRIDPGSFTVTASIPVGGAKGIAIVGNAAWVTASITNELVKIDLSSNRVVATFPVGTGPDAIAVDGDALWVTNRREGTVVRFDTLTEQVTARVVTGNAPAGIAVDGDRVWVIDADEGTLVLVDRATATVVQSIAVGPRPLGLQPLDDRVWVGVADDDVLAEIEVDHDDPVHPAAEIVSVETAGGRFVPTFASQNFTPDIGGDLHVHLYWNSIPVVEAGSPGAGPWLLWDQPVRVDDEFFDLANRPAEANAICIVVANTVHQIADVDGDGAPDFDTGNCVQLPGEPA